MVEVSIKDTVDRKTQHNFVLILRCLHKTKHRQSTPSVNKITYFTLLKIIKQQIEFRLLLKKQN